MKKSIIVVLLILTACKKEVVIEKQTVIENQGNQKQDRQNENRDSSKERIISFNQQRKTEIEFNETNEYITNLKSFISDTDKRIIEVKVENIPLNNGNLKCFDVSTSLKKNLIVDQAFLNNGTKALAEIQIEPNNFQDINVKCIVSDDTSSELEPNLFEFNFELQNDLIIEDEKSISELGLKADNQTNKIDHLLILEEGKLKLKDKNITLNTKNVVALKGAKIVTFGSDTDAKENFDGANGGSFILFSNNATGNLEFILNGQNGGRVTKIPEAPRNYPSYYREGILDGENSRLENIEICDDRDDRPRCHYELQITNSPTSGKAGLKGQTGIQGFSGKNGGHSGFAKLYIKNSSPIQFKIESVPGKFSLGGSGSPGGPGTPGGRADCHWDQILIEFCQQANIRNGATGPIGDSGVLGVNGAYGMKLESIYINQENSSLNKIF